MQVNQQLVFVDSQIRDYQTLVAGVVSGIEVVVLEPNHNGIEQITSVLSQRTNIDTVHIVSHGSPGCLYLGSTQLSLDTLNVYQSKIKTWFTSSFLSPRSSLLIYGCNVAAGDAGAEFVAKLNQITGADIAASSTPIGHIDLGGNWELDRVAGESKTAIAIAKSVQQSWQGVLAAPFPEAEPDVDTSAVTLLPLNIDLAIGNILANDTPGDSPTRVASVAVQGDSNSLVSLDTPLVEVGLLTPQGGNLVLLGNGIYTYTPPLLVSEFTEVFDYTIIDGDGDMSTSTLTINANGAGSATVTSPSIDLDSDDNNTVDGNFRNVFVIGGAGVNVTDNDLDIIGDSDNTKLAQIEVEITNGQSGDRLFATSSLLDGSLLSLPSFNASYNPETFRLTITPRSGLLATVGGLLSDIESVLASVKFETTSNNATEREISITATDEDGDTSDAVQANIAVSSTSNIDPVAEADFNTSDNIVGSDPTTGALTLNITTGNVLRNDDLGNTPTRITSASVEGQSGSLINLNTLLAQAELVTSNGGILLLAANGSYIYTPPTLGLFDPGITEVFNYTITDADGQTSTNTLTINAKGGAPIINESLIVDLDSNDNNTVDGQFGTRFVIGGSGVAIADTDLLISDSDDPDVELSEVKILLNNAEVGDLLAVNVDDLPDGIISTIENSVTGKVQLTLSATNTSASLANFQTALSKIIFNTTNTDTTDREISVTAIDANGEQSIAALANIAIAPTVELSVTPVSLTGSEADGTAFTITANALAAVNGDQTIDLDLSGIDASDYNLSANQITIADGATSGSVTLTIIDDDEPEPEETISLSLFNLSAGIELGTSTTASLTIADNDNPTAIDLDDNNNNTVDGKFQNLVTIGADVASIADVDLTLVDPDNANLASLEVTILNAKEGDQLLVNSLQGALPISIEAVVGDLVDGQIQLTLLPKELDSLPLATFQTALSLIGFSTTSTDITDREISVTAIDTDGNTSVPALANIDILRPLNELLTVDLDDNNNNTVDSQFQSLVTIGADVAPIADADVNLIDTGNVGLASVEVSLLNAKEGDQLLVDSSKGVLPTSIEAEIGELVDGQLNLTLLPTGTGNLSLVDLQAALSLIGFSTNSTDITDREISVTAIDVNGGKSPAALANIGILRPLNELLTVDLDGNDDKTVDGQFQSLVTIGADVAPIADVDVNLIDTENVGLASVEVSLLNAKEGDQLLLEGVLPTSIEAEIGELVDGQLNLTLLPTGTGNLSLVDLQAALSLIGFSTNSTDITDREISVTAIDVNGAKSPAALANIEILRPLNELLTIDLDGNDNNTVDGQFQSLVTIGADVAPIADVDVNLVDTENVGLASVEVSLLNAKEGDQLLLEGVLPTSIEAEIGELVDGQLNLTLLPTGTGNLSLVDLQAALSLIGFSTDSTDITDREISVTAIDVNGAKSPAALANIAIGLPINESLTVDLDGDDNNTVDGKFRSIFAIGGSGVAIADDDLLVSDSINPNLELNSIEVMLSNAQVGDELSLSNLPASIASEIGVSVDTSVTGEIKLTLSAADDGSLPLSTFQTALSSVIFKNTNSNPSRSDRQILVTAIDVNEKRSVPAQASIAVSKSSSILPVTKPDFNTSDDILETDPTTGEVSLNIISGNVLSNDNPGNTPIYVSSASVQGNGDSLVTLDSAVAQVTLLSPQGGTLVLTGTGDYVYTPPTFGLNDPGITEVFNYTITDADGDSSTSTLTINAKGGGDLAPVAQPDTNTAVEAGTIINANLLANDALGDIPTTITTAVAGSTALSLKTPFITTNGGVFTLAANGSYAYIPPKVGTLPSAGATETIEYTIADDDGQTSTSTLVIEVEQAAPVAKKDNPIALAGSSVAIDVLRNDRNEGEIVSADITVKLLDDTGNPVDNLSIKGQGTWSVRADKSILFTPDTKLTGDPKPVSYQIIDADGQASAAAKIAIDYQEVVEEQIAIERVSADDFYFNPGNKIASNYAAYKVTNNSEADIQDLWVEIDNFAGGNIKLAEGESSQVNLGSLASGESTTTFFYLTATGETTAEQSHSVSVYDGSPTEQGILQGQADFSFAEAIGIEADNSTGDRNIINSVDIDVNPALPGDLVTVTVEGQTGTIGSEGILSFSPASFANWNPDTYELIDTSITFDGGGIGTVEDRLLIQAPDASGLNLPYTATYTFEVAAIADVDLELSPIGSISSGTEIKHTSIANFDSFVNLEAVNGTGVISGAEWNDTNNNGALDLGETGIANATVNLFGVRNPNKPLATVNTNVGGAYEFINIPTGSYYLEFVRPRGYAISPEERDNTGTGLLDSDVNRVTGRTDVFELAPDETIVNLNAGVTADSDDDGIPNSVEGEGDRDGDGVPDYLDVDPEGYFYAQETGEVIPGGLVSVTGPSEQASDNVDLRNDGSETGYYQWFIDPEFPGTYTMDIIPPEGYIVSPERPASNPPPIDATTLLPEDPYSMGSARNETTGKLISSEFVDNPYYLTFDLAGGDPFIINNNIPLVAPPILDLNGNAAGNDGRTVYTIGQDSVSIIDSVDNFSLIDKDDLNLQSATIKLATRPDGDNAERLIVGGALPDGIDPIAYDNATGILELNGDAPIDDYITSLTQIEYTNDIGIKTSDRLVEISLSDGDYDSDIATSIIEMNLPPVIDLDDNNSSFI